MVVASYRYCGKAFERPFDLSRHEARHEARLARTGQLSLKDVSRKSKPTAAPSTQTDTASSSSSAQVVEPASTTSSLEQLGLQTMGFPSLDQGNACFPSYRRGLIHFCELYILWNAGNLGMIFSDLHCSFSIITPLELTAPDRYYC